MRTTKVGGLNALSFLPPPPPSLLLSAPLFNKRSVLLGNFKRKIHLEILTCFFALIILLKD